MPTISSNTDDGHSAACPSCGSVFLIAATSQRGDAPCPVCGRLVWYLAFPTRVFCFKSLVEVERLIEQIRDGSVHDRSQPWNEAAIDSIELAEWLVALESQEFE